MSFSLLIYSTYPTNAFILCNKYQRHSHLSYQTQVKISPVIVQSPQIASSRHDPDTYFSPLSPPGFLLCCSLLSQHHASIFSLGMLQACFLPISNPKNFLRISHPHFFIHSPHMSKPSQFVSLYYVQYWCYMQCLSNMFIPQYIFLRHIQHQSQYLHFCCKHLGLLILPSSKSLIRISVQVVVWSYIL